MQLANLSGLLLLAPGGAAMLAEELRDLLLQLAVGTLELCGPCLLELSLGFSKSCSEALPAQNCIFDLPLRQAGGLSVRFRPVGSRLRAPSWESPLAPRLAGSCFPIPDRRAGCSHQIPGCLPNMLGGCRGGLPVVRQKGSDSTPGRRSQEELRHHHYWQRPGQTDRQKPLLPAEAVSCGPERTAAMQTEEEAVAAAAQFEAQLEAEGE